MLSWIEIINSISLEVKIFGIIVYTFAIPFCFWLYFKLRKRRGLER